MSPPSATPASPRGPATSPQGLPKTLLALSRAPGRLDDARWGRLREAAGSALMAVAGRDAAMRADPPDGLVLVTECSEGDRAPGDGLVVTLSLGPRTEAGARLDAADLARRLSEGRIGDLAPPFATCAVERDSGTVCAATDRVGLRHVYWLQREGWAALSTSSMLLARLAGATLDEQAIGVYALVGNYLGVRTPFAGVRVLPAGSVARLAAGVVEIGAAPAGAPRPERLGRAAAVARGVAAVREVVDGCLQAHAEPLLELSGGLDSRMVLAAVPPQRRRGLRAVTVGPAGSADHRVAALLAERCGMAHQRVTFDGLDSLGPQGLLALATAAAHGRDCTGNPTALAVLDWQERALDQGPRLTGQNGEFARGFYYPGQRAHPRTTPDLVDALGRWRVFVNEAADPALFAEGFLADAREAALREMREEFEGYGTDWLSATDEFYLGQRMRRWVGVGYSASCLRRTVQSPFFHRAYLDWARSCTPEDKRGSRVFAEVLSQLDEDLALVRLDSGRAPRALAAPSPLERVTALRDTLRKVARKVDQRVRGRGRPPSGAGAVAAGVQAAWAQQDGALAGLAGLPFLDGRALEEVASGRRPVNPASVGLLLDLDVAVRTTAR